MNEKGELIDKRANKTLSWGAEPPFIKMYLNDIVYMSDLPKSYGSILYEMFKYMTYAGEKDGMVIFINGYVKANIVQALSLKTTQSIDNAITKLVKGNILKRISRGTYRANPYLFERAIGKILPACGWKLITTKLKVGHLKRLVITMTKMVIMSLSCQLVKAHEL